MAFICTIIVEILALSMMRDSAGYLSNYPVGIIILISSAVYVFQISKMKKARYAKTPLLIGYFWRLFLVFWDIFFIHIFPLPNSGADSSMFFRTSVQFFRAGNSGTGEVFSTIMGVVFKLSGISKLYGQYIIMLSSMVTIYLLARMLDNSKLDIKSKYRIVMLVSILPNYAILSSIFLREAFVTTLITFSLFFFMKWLYGGKNMMFYIACAFSVLAATLHSGSIAMLVGLIVVRMLYDKQNERIKFRLSNLIPVVILSLIMVYLFLNYGDVFFSKMLKINSIENIGNTSAEGGSSYAAYVGDSSTPLNMIIYTIPRIFYFLFSPFPWQWRGINDIIAFCFSGAFYFLCVWNAIKCLRSRENMDKSKLIALLIVTFFVVFVFAWGVSNTGTATRHRDKLIIVFSCIYAFSYQKRKGVSVVAGKKHIL